LALQNGVDIKTVSSNLGHATVAFTMDKYAHVSETMQKDSVTKMEAFIAGL
jgi:site-specific recombinase XerD